MTRRFFGSGIKSALALLTFLASQTVQAQTTPTLELSITTEAANPQAIAEGFWNTLHYSCSGGDCVDPKISVYLPDVLSVSGNVPNSQFDQFFQQYLGEYFWFTSSAGRIPAGSSGEIKFRTGFKGTTTCNETVAPLVGTFSVGDLAVQSNPVEITAQAAHLFTVGVQRLRGGAVGENTEYQVTIAHPPVSGKGALGLYGATLRQILPSGAEFVESRDGGVYNPVSHEVVWQMGDLTYVAGASTLYIRKSVLLRFPGESFNVGDQVNTSVELKGIGPDNCAAEFATIGSAVDVLLAARPEGTVRKYLQSTDQRIYPGYENWYLLNPENMGNVPLVDFEVTDVMHPAFEVSGVRSGRFVNYGQGSVEILYQKNDQPEWHSLGFFDPDVSEDVTFFPQPDARTSGSGWQEGDFVSTLKWNYGTVPVGFNVENFSNGPGFWVVPNRIGRDGIPLENGDVIRNWAGLHFTYDGQPYGRDQFFSRDGVVADRDPLITTTVDLLNGTTRSPGEEFRIQLSIANATIPDAVLRNGVFTYTMPDILELVSIDSLPECFDAESIGQTVTLTCPNLEGIRFDAYITVRAKSDAAPGTYTNTMEVAGDNLWRFLNYPKSFSIVTVADLTAAKLVQGSNDYPNFVAIGTEAETVYGGAVNYRMTVANTGNVALSDLVVVDILPHVGDTQVLGQAAARESAWTPQLVAPIESPAGVSVQYSIESNPCRDDLGRSGFPSGCSAAAWTDEPPSPITAVRSLKFEFDQTLAPSEELLFEWSMVAPLGAEYGSAACNSFGFSAARSDNGSPLLPTEPQPVCVRIEPLLPAAIGDFVWEDANFNGRQDDGETGVNGVQVKLWLPGNDGKAGTADDVLATDRSGNPMQTVTASNAAGQDGFYTFSNLDPGNYFLEFIPPEGKSFAFPDTGDDSLDSDVDPATGRTPIIALGPEVLNTVDAAVRPPNFPPLAVAGEDRNQECSAPESTTVVLDASGSEDPDGDALTYTWSNAEGQIISGPSSDAVQSVSLGNGTHELTLTVEDAKGATSTDDLVVVIEDTSPPSFVSASGAVLMWPPNHKYSSYNLTDLLSVSDACDTSVGTGTLSIVSISSDEPEDVGGNGDGKTLNDMVIHDGCQSFDLRAERQGAGNGRVYRVAVSAVDAAGNEATAEVLFGVPHDQKDTPIDDGEAYRVDAMCTVAGKGLASDSGFDSGEPQVIPESVELSNYPNPFNPTTTVVFGLPEDGQVKLTVFDLLGRQVRVLATGPFEAGTHSVQFDASTLPSGTYLIRIVSGSESLTKTMRLIK